MNNKTYNCFRWAMYQLYKHKSSGDLVFGYKIVEISGDHWIGLSREGHAMRLHQEHWTPEGDRKVEIFVDGIKTMGYENRSIRPRMGDFVTFKLPRFKQLRKEYQEKLTPECWNSNYFTQYYLPIDVPSDVVLGTMLNSGTCTQHVKCDLALLKEIISTLSVCETK